MQKSWTTSMLTTAVSTAFEAKALCIELMNLYKRGGLRLTKWINNDKSESEQSALLANYVCTYKEFFFAQCIYTEINTHTDTHQY